MKKVNLGSGTTCLDDWINVDSSFNARLAKHPRLRHLLFKVGFLPRKYYEMPWVEHAKSLLVRDVKKGLPFRASSIDFIYSSHFIEYLTKAEARKLLKECLRVLKRKGVLRLSIRDLEVLARNYLKQLDELRADGGRVVHLPADGFIDSLLLVDAEPEKSPPLMERLFIPRCKWIYDEFSLAELLESCGFVNVEKRSYQVGKVPDIELLDNRPRQSLYLEAEKP
jgi:SAM-dependent methyltransferase